MQTFLPYEDFALSAKALDYKRLGKQRVECKQILAALGYELARNGTVVLRPPSTGWVNHPCTRMWVGYEDALVEYQRQIILEWVGRGYNNTMILALPGGWQPPPWLGDEALHASHRSNLLRKDPEYYGRHGWTESPDLPYFYPDASYQAQRSAGDRAELDGGLLSRN